MNHYQLDVLNDKEFEDLSRDLLEKELGVALQSFKTGRDKGIDLRYANAKENEIIVQAKHYIKTGFSKLKKEVVNEKLKMDQLSPGPKRYILITSLPLSVHQTDELVTLMSPYVKSTQDIYGVDRVNALIAASPELERRYYKLWLTSTNVLNEILYNAVNGRSTFFKERILQKVSYYVPTIDFNQAVDKLNENHFIIVSGEPGIGKTTISYLLICDLMAKGYQLIYVDDHLKDAEDLLSPSPEVKQVVFFDDFFGANLSEIMHPRNTESKIVGFVERIQASPHKFMILTTRTTILNQAQHQFEKFRRSGLFDLSKYELKIESYSKLDRAKILYNHLYHSDKSLDQYEVFFQSKNYLKIIEHKNYFPRLIEFITSARQLENLEPKGTERFIFDSLNEPAQIWQHAFESQLNAEEQFLLQTLFSLGGYGIPVEQLELAFEARYRYEIEHNGHALKTDAYNSSLKKLMDGFIRSLRDTTSGKLTFSVLNPSVSDFLISYLRERPAEQKRILFSAVYFKQITRYFMPDGNHNIVLPDNQRKAFFKRFQEMLPKLMEQSADKTSGGITALHIYFAFFSEIVSSYDLREIFDVLDFTIMENVFLREFTHAFDRLAEYGEFKKLVYEQWPLIFSNSLNLVSDSYDIKGMIDLMKRFEITQEVWSNEKDFVVDLQYAANQSYQADEIDISSSEDDIVEANNSGYPTHAMEIIEDRLADDYSEFLEDCGLSDFFDEFYQDADLDPQSIFDRIIENHSYDGDDYEPGMHVDRENDIDEDAEIRRLFER